MTLEDKVYAFRLHALQRAEQLGNVSAMCRELGISRTVFYRWRSRLKAYGTDGLHPRRCSATQGRPSSLSLQDEQAILALAVSQPARGPQDYAVQLAQQGRLCSPSTIYRALRRVGLGTRVERLTLLERYSARRAGLLTERTRCELLKARRRRITFTSDRAGTTDIFVMNADGSAAVPLTDSPFGAYDPDWSPDGAFDAADSIALTLNGLF